MQSDLAVTGNIAKAVPKVRRAWKSLDRLAKPRGSLLRSISQRRKAARRLSPLMGAVVGPQCRKSPVWPPHHEMNLSQCRVLRWPKGLVDIKNLHRWDLKQCRRGCRAMGGRVKCKHVVLYLQQCCMKRSPLPARFPKQFVVHRCN